MTGPVNKRGHTSNNTGEVASSNGHTAKPAVRSRCNTGNPRKDPAPTLPAPDTWNVDFGDVDPTVSPASVTRRCAGSSGRGWPVVPQNGGATSASHPSASTVAARQSSGA